MLFRNLLFYAGVIPATLFFAVLGSLVFFLPLKQRYWITTRWSHFLIYWAKLTCGLSYHVSGLSHLPKTNAIVLSNHQSTWETIFMQVLFPLQTWVLKKELLWIPAFGWGLWLIKPIAINRNARSSAQALIEQGTKRLKEGAWVILFPEGTRVRKGSTKKFSRSGALLAKASGYPIVPLAHNAGNFWPRGFFIKKSGVIEVKIGPTLYVEEKSVQELHEQAEKWIKEKARKLP